jgi:16S rRNA (cytidine1402-2'-O)-methyltransferase
MENQDQKVIKAHTGTLYLVSTPIGNKEDITLRALRVLKTCELVVCEEYKVGARFLHQYNLTKDIELLNEQNETEKSPELLEMLMDGKDLVLISDCGTPVIADPGGDLVRLAIKNNIEINVVPGVSSIMTAIVRCGFSLVQFIYGGFLSRDKDERFDQLRELSQERKTIVLLETPYRMNALLYAASVVMPDRRAYIGCNLTMPFETNHYGTFEELFKKFENVQLKAEFVIVFEGNTKVSHVVEKSSHRESRFERGDRPSSRTEHVLIKRDSSERTIESKESYGGDDRRKSFTSNRDSGERGYRGKTSSYGRDDRKKSYGGSSRDSGDRGFKSKDSFGRDDRKKSYGGSSRDSGDRGFKSRESFGSDDRKKSYGGSSRDTGDRGFKGRDSFVRDDRKKSFSGSSSHDSGDRSFGDRDKRERDFRGSGSGEKKFRPKSTGDKKFKGDSKGKTFRSRGDKSKSPKNKDSRKKYGKD